MLRWLQGTTAPLTPHIDAGIWFTVHKVPCGPGPSGITLSTSSYSSLPRDQISLLHQARAEIEKRAHYTIVISAFLHKLNPIALSLSISSSVGGNNSAHVPFNASESNVQ